MIAPPEMRSPAPALESGLDRADIIRNDAMNTTDTESAEAFAALFVAHRFRLPINVARLVCRLATIGERCA